MDYIMVGTISTLELWRSNWRQGPACRHLKMGGVIHESSTPNAVNPMMGSWWLFYGEPPKKPKGITKHDWWMTLTNWWFSSGPEPVGFHHKEGDVGSTDDYNKRLAGQIAASEKNLSSDDKNCYFSKWVEKMSWTAIPMDSLLNRLKMSWERDSHGFPMSWLLFPIK